ncbi:hypothetical protein FRC01_001221, partial [Tulasnella sp. 417]
MLVMMWVDEEHPGQVQTMLQTGRGKASTDISNFCHSGPFVDAELLARWRSWASRVFELNDNVSHTMYEHVTPDEAVGCPEGTVPQIRGYSGAVDTSSDVKMAKARTDLLKYMGERWCKVNNRQRVNHDQMQLDINDKVPKSRLPKATRPTERERVMPDGSSVIETVDREVEITYTKFTTMPTQDFLVWLHHLADPEIPPENQFYFSAELQQAEEAGATMPVTVQAALAWPPKPEEDAITAPNARRPSNNSQQGTAPPKKRSKKAKNSRATGGSGLTKAKSKRKKGARDQHDDNDHIDEAEDFELPSSDDLDDLSDVDLPAQPPAGSRQSRQIKEKEKSKVEAPISGDDEPSRSMPFVTSNSHCEKEVGNSTRERDHQFLSAVSIMTPTRRLPGAFSLSPSADPLNPSRVSQVINLLTMAKSNVSNLPLPDFSCNKGRTRMSGPKTVYDILCLMTMLDHLFPQRPEINHPPFCVQTTERVPSSPALVSAVSEQVWKLLNNPNAAIPMVTALQRICTRHPDYIQDTFNTASVYVREAIKVLRRRSFLSPEKQVYTATRVFSTLCRYILFIGRVPSQANTMQNLVDVISEWGTVLVTLTYAVHTTQSTLLRYTPSEPGHPLTASTVIPQLLSSFLESLYQYIYGQE